MRVPGGADAGGAEAKKACDAGNRARAARRLAHLRSASQCARACLRARSMGGLSGERDAGSGARDRRRPSVE